MGKACVIGHITVKDPVKWAEYRNQVAATLLPWGGEALFRGKQVAVFAGTHSTTDVVVIRFPDIEAAHHWHGSPAYQALIPLRQQAAEVVLLCYES